MEEPPDSPPAALWRSILALIELAGANRGSRRERQAVESLAAALAGAAFAPDDGKHWRLAREVGDGMDFHLTARARFHSIA